MILRAFVVALTISITAPSSFCQAQSGSKDVSSLAGKPVRLRIVLREADLYALQFAP